MKRLYVKQIKECSEKEVLVKGWVHQIVDFKNFSFIKLRDKTGIIQLVVDGEELSKLKLEMSIEVIGEKVSNTKAPNGVEIKVKNLKIVGNTYYDMLPIKINEYKDNTKLETELY